MSNKVKILSNKKNVCPYCNSIDIDYDSLEIVDELAYHPCTCIKCNRTFEQWYEFKFAGHNVGACGTIEAENVINKEIDYEEE